MRCNIAINSRTQRYALTPLIAAPIARSLQGSESGILKTLRASKPPASTITGIESKNEKFALAVREKPSISAAVIVTPERETPGMSAIACARPMIRAIFIVMTVSSFAPLFLSAKPKINPKTMVIIAIKAPFLAYCSIKSPKARPNSPTGIVPKPVAHTSVLWPTVFF